MATDNFTNTNDTALTTHNANLSFITGNDGGRIYDNGVSYFHWNYGAIFGFLDEFSREFHNKICLQHQE